MGADAPRKGRGIEVPSVDEPDDGASDAARTGVMTRIESAIPPADDDASPAAARDRMPRPRVFAFAALLAVTVVGGAALLITHPWDPSASVTRASEPADTSMSGYPGAVESLSGQDRDDEATGEGQVAPVDPLDVIAEAHEDLGGLEEQVDASEETLRSVVSGTADVDVEEALRDARSVSISVSNLIARVDQMSDGDGAYAEDIENLRTLGNWLRNRCDAITASWELVEGSPTAADAAEQVLSSLGATSDYKRLFAEKYEAWSPGSEDGDGSES